MTYRWFNEHMSFPGPLPRNAVCWFRADAAECVGRLRVLIEAYRMAGHAILMQATQVPGRVVYQDEIQVAADALPGSASDVFDALNVPAKPLRRLTRQCSGPSRRVSFLVIREPARRRLGH